MFMVMVIAGFAIALLVVLARAARRGGHGDTTYSDTSFPADMTTDYRDSDACSDSSGDTSDCGGDSGSSD